MLGLSEKAEATHRKALDLQNKIPGVARSEMTLTLNDLALALRDQGAVSQEKVREAEKLHREVLELRRAMPESHQTNVAIALENLGTVLRKQGKLADAEDFTKQALELQTRLLENGAPAIARCRNNLALILAD